MMSGVLIELGSRYFLLLLADRLPVRKDSGGHLVGVHKFKPQILPSRIPTIRKELCPAHKLVVSKSMLDA